MPTRSHIGAHHHAGSAIWFVASGEVTYIQSPKSLRISEASGSFSILWYPTPDHPRTQLKLTRLHNQSLRLAGSFARRTDRIS